MRMSSRLIGRCYPGGRGFSLLEMLIVIMVIGILYSLAGSMLNLSVSDPLNEEVSRLQTRVLMAQDESIVRSQALALGFSDTGYAFFAQDEHMQWQPVQQDALLGNYAFRGGMSQPYTYKGRRLPCQRPAASARKCLSCLRGK